MLIENEHREYMVHSTLMFPEGSRVGMNVQPVDIHVMKREGMSHEKNEDSAYPYSVWMAIFIVVPILLVLLYSLTEGDIRNLAELRFFHAEL